MSTNGRSSGSIPKPRIIHADVSLGYCINMAGSYGKGQAVVAILFRFSFLLYVVTELGKP